ncbi:APC5 protein [Coniosporium tulheliwenetii]|uniref:APC5 protein n=1 Tax=Coniosporium tulheliwenetii TaxID=3383036 RepID=A0ACC2Z1M7_9PEZI|nr:APC5 protein [Cladosporium sp. JES 115]
MTRYLTPQKISLLVLISLYSAGETSLEQKDRVALSRTSLLGAFVRRSQLEFIRLQLDDTIRLWADFLAYKEPTESTWRRRNQSAGANSFDVNVQELGLHDGSPLMNVAYGRLTENRQSGSQFSAHDMEELLKFQVESLQKLGNRVSDEMKANLRKMSGHETSTPSLLHFLRTLSFLDAWRAGDYTSSFDNLHRYFDYTMQTGDKTYYQYALLHMAMLQADFGSYSGAIAAAHETIATARENQDMSCLNFSLSWLNHLSNAYPTQLKAAGYSPAPGSKKDAVAFLKARAKDGKMWSLLSSTLLNEAKLSLSSNVQAGHYKAAQTLLDNIDPTTHRTLKLHQYITTCSGLAALTHSIRQSNNDTSLPLLRRLLASRPSDPELAHHLHTLEIEHLLRTHSFESALTKIEDLATELRDNDADLALRLHALRLKADLFIACGHPAKGFSVAMRAASAAHRARMLPALWGALGAVGACLIQLEEFGAVGEIMEAVVPQALEGGDEALCAQLYSLQADAWMGLAGQAMAGEEPRRGMVLVGRADVCVERALERYERIDDTDGRRDMLLKKAVIARLRGEEAAAEDWAARYLEVGRGDGIATG